ALHGRFGRLEAHLRVRAVAEWLVDGAAAAAERDAGLARQVVAIAVGVEQLDFAQVAFHAIRAVALCRDLDVSHRSSENALDDTRRSLVTPCFVAIRRGVCATAYN